MSRKAIPRKVLRKPSPRLTNIYNYLLKHLPNNEYVRAGDIYGMLIDKQVVRNKGVNPIRTAATDLKCLREANRSVFARAKKIVCNTSPHADRACIVWKTEKGKGYNGMEYYYKVQKANISKNHFVDVESTDSENDEADEESDAQVSNSSQELSLKESEDTAIAQLVGSEPPSKRQKTTHVFQPATETRCTDKMSALLLGTQVAEKLWQTKPEQGLVQDMQSMMLWAAENPQLMQSFLDGFQEANQFSNTR